MIDIHCHLEQPDYDNDRDAVVEKCRRSLQSLITSCGHPKDFGLTINLVEKFNGFVFATASIHPQYVSGIGEGQIEDFIASIRDKKGRLVGIGESGLDYYWVKDEGDRKRQEEMFVRFISLARDLGLPLIVHSRDSYEEAIKVMEQEGVDLAVMHMFGANRLVKRVIENGWYISVNTIVMKSKHHKKVVRDTPTERLLLETDSPWLAPEGFGNLRNDPTAVKYVAERVAEVKKITFDEVDEATTENAIRLFKLPLKQ